MKRIILDEEFLAKLGDLKESWELCDKAGNMLGKFTPASEMETLFQWEPELSEEELLRREQEPEISTAELLARLESL